MRPLELRVEQAVDPSLGFLCFGPTGSMFSLDFWISFAQTPQLLVGTVFTGT